MVVVIGALGSANRYISYLVYGWSGSMQGNLINLSLFHSLSGKNLIYRYPIDSQSGEIITGCGVWFGGEFWNFSVVFQSGNCLMASGNYVRITWKRSRAMSHVTLRQNINMLFTFVNISFRALINRVRISILCIMLGIDSILTLWSKFTQTNLQHPPFLYLRTSFKKLVNFTNTFSVCSFHTFL